MKAEFDVALDFSLEELFIKRIIPELDKTLLKDSRKTDLDLSTREHLGLVILSYFFRYIHKGKEFRPAIRNADFDDGAIADLSTGQFFPVEQVYIYEGIWKDRIIDGIIDAIQRKDAKGYEYAKGNILFIYADVEGDLDKNVIVDSISKSNFEYIFIVGPAGTGPYDYNVLVSKTENFILNFSYLLSINPETGVCVVKDL